MKLREWIANLLDRFPDTCSYWLSGWVVQPNAILLRRCIEQPCVKDPCCGKCWNTGRLPVEWGRSAFQPRKYWRIPLKRLLGVRR